jgi:hypothetical protein
VLEGGREKALTDAGYSLTDAVEKASARGEDVRRCPCVSSPVTLIKSSHPP